MPAPNEIISLINEIRDKVSADFILVGGAAGNFQGNDQVTSDIDLLVRDPKILEELQKIEGFQLKDRALNYKSTSYRSAPNGR
ncbi:hypothetical protein N7495_008289 [Penicillium taxi]|uniref:uncharacterized protein n=1 Tax=Penicillium taxi TaxID=168475 RepID=UPI002544E953|nr:uncharacterized protein N7495_008289 [Penicillium taxi]KAJ5888248.1 hypothetical protein N7495_008289 [Penicillium taxi]